MMARLFPTKEEMLHALIQIFFNGGLGFEGYFCLPKRDVGFVSLQCKYMYNEFEFSKGGGSRIPLIFLLDPRMCMLILIC